ncbi:MAG: ABC transporter ATP-binding protein [Alphaproteobacteria bacterium]|nr:MAG: ABC transporter ATP-binding protein [Alphaproteobacteria bacterium]
MGRQKTLFISLKDIFLSLKSEAGEVRILKDVNLDVKKGESVSIIGPSGAGKTSLLMLLGGLEKPSAGTITIAGEELSGMGEDALTGFRQKNIGIVFQSFHLIPTMTALENVAVPLEFAHDPAAFKKAENALEKVGLGHRLTHYPAQLSGGEQQRVALARAFVTEPALLLADEPTGNLDQTTGHKVIELLFDLAKSKGTTLILVTHDFELAARCDRSVTIADGVLHQ